MDAIYTVNTHPSIHPFSLLFQGQRAYLRCHRMRKARYTLDRSPINHKANGKERQAFTNAPKIIIFNVTYM